MYSDLVLLLMEVDFCMAYHRPNRSQTKIKSLLTGSGLCPTVQHYLSQAFSIYFGSQGKLEPIPNDFGCKTGSIII